MTAAGAELPPLSFSQERLWFLQQLAPWSTAYHLRLPIRLRGRLDVAALEAAFNELIRRHDALRTSFPAAAGVPRQRVHPHVPFSLPPWDLRGLGTGPRAEVVARRIDAVMGSPFDLGAPPLRIELLRLADQEHLLLVCAHHIVADAWSLGLVFRDLSALYASFLAGGRAELRSSVLRFVDHAVGQRRSLAEELDGHLEYWRGQLRDAPASPPLEGSGNPKHAALAAVHSFRVAGGLTARLAGLARQERASIFMTLLAGFGLLLHRYAGRDDVLVGVPVSGRGRPELLDVVGCFVNTIVLRSRLPRDMTVRGLLRATRESALDAFDHQDLPFDLLVRELQPKRDPGKTPFVSVLFNLIDRPGDALLLPGLEVSQEPASAGHAMVDLNVELMTAGSELAGEIEFRTDVFEAPTIARLANHYVRLLEEMAAVPDRRAWQVPFLGGDELERLSRWARGPAGQPGPATLTGLLETRPRRVPDGVAVQLAGKRVGFVELQRRASALAGALRELGVGAGSIVGIHAERSVELVVGLLGALQAGGAYLPLDPDYPAERIRFMLADARPAVVLSQRHLLGRLPHTDARLVCVDEAGGRAAGMGVEPGPDDLAYVIYTSGSTGQPKGAMNTHRAVSNRLRWMRREFRLDASDAVLQKTPFGFDVSVWELLLPLITGARLVLAPPGAERDAAAIARLVAEHRITTLHFVPSMLQAFLDVPGVAGQCATLRRVICSGEVLTGRLRARFQATLAAKLHNLYGPTEAAIDVTHSACSPADARAAPIGRPISDVRTHVLDGEMWPRPIGAAGELYLGGECVGRGYLGQPALTAERFLPDPFGRPGERLYRTGDLVRYGDGGELEFLGRVDQQVKIRGQRIEPAEIEAALEAHPEVRRAVVTVRRAGDSDERLVAYIVTGAGDGLPARLRAFLADRLPASMLPAAYVPVPSLPLTPSGKLDRAALPPPDAASLATSGDGRAPRTPTEELLAETWAELLGVRPGPDEDFFHLGGHSLLAMRLVSLVRDRLGAEIAVRTVFERPRLEALAAEVERAARRPEAPPIEPTGRGGPLPLTDAQEQIWFLDQLAAGRPLYNLATACRLRAGVGAPLIASGLSEVVRRHEALRTVVVADRGRLAQRVLSPSPIVVRELAAADEAGARRLMTDEARRPFDLATGPLLRATLIRVGDGESVLVLVAHHIVSDGRSTEIVWRELAANLRAAAAGDEPPRRPPPLQYGDFAVWQRAHPMGAGLSFWRERLRGTPGTLDLPLARSRPPVRRFRGTHTSIAVPYSLAAEVETCARQEGVTTFMLLLAAFYALLHRCTGQDDVVIGVPVANRKRSEVADVVGLFSNMLPIRVRVHGAMTVRQLLAAVREAALDAFDHQDVPFERIVEELRLRRDPSYSPLVQVMFTYEESSESNEPFLGPAWSIATDTSKFDLTLYFRRQLGGIAGSLEYDLDSFEESTVRGLLGQYRTLLEAMIVEPDVQLDDLPFLVGKELDRVLRDWNDTAARFPRGRSLDQLVEAQVRRTPLALAVFQDAGGSLTYARLDAAASAVASKLTSAGIRRGSVVAVCLPPSPGLVAALLGVWKAGGICLPLDPEHPAGRLALMVDEARPAALVTGLAAVKVPTPGAAVVMVDEAGVPLTPAARTAGASLPAAGPEDLAAILYTSGSTGRPKGVMLIHGDLVNVIHQRNVVHRVTAADRVLQNFSIAFDPTLWQVLGPLMVGGMVVMPAPGRHRDLAYTLELVRRAGVSIVDSTPSSLAAMLEQREPRRALEHVRSVFCGGEPLTSKLIDRFRANSGAELTNIYGTTEASIDVTSWRCQPGPGFDRAPIGRPVANKRIYVLDPDMRPVPPGVRGELYVGGIGVARGYLKRPGLTAERFVPDSFSGERGARLFRTGDYGRHLADGCLEFLGRRDDMVKVRGHRVEPGEVERVLLDHPAVAGAAVVPFDEPDGGASLIAYLVAGAGEPPSSRELARHLRQALPAYMMPSRYVPIDSIPLTETGKVDRLRLAKLTSARRLRPKPEARATGPTEAAITAIWRDVLELDSMDVEADFFTSGGHSLSALKLLARIQEVLGVTIPIRDLLTDPTVSGLAAAAERARAQAG